MNGQLLGYTYITSPFGYRNAPTCGAGTFHGGIDIGAPSGAKIISAFSGKVTFLGFYGANGYTIQIENGNYLATYSHISPYFLVYINQFVNKGDVIAIVGPKNVYGVPNNPYKDYNGVPTNGATTRSSSAFLNKSKWNFGQSFNIFLTKK